MKKFGALLGVLIVVALIGRALVGGVGPTSLTVEVVHAADGRDLSARARVFVGYVDGQPMATPTLGNMTLIQPREPSSLTYEIPSSHNVGIFALANEMLPQHVVARVPGGGHETHTVILDDRRGTPKFSFVSVVPWANNFPTVNYVIASEVTGKFDKRYGRIPPTLPYGEHKVGVRLSHQGQVVINPVIASVQTFSVDAAEVALTLPISVRVVLPTFEDWTQDELADMTVIIVSTSDTMWPLASARIEDQSAPLVFLAEDTAQTYAVALIKQRDIVAFQDIGPVQIDSPVSARILRGGDAVRCAEYIDIFLSCDTLDGE